MRLSILLLVLFSGPVAMGQNLLSGKIVGQRFDALPSVSVMLRLQGDSTRQLFAITDTSGNFSFRNISKGVYQLTATRTGHKPGFISSFTVKDTGYQLLPVMILADTARAMEVVTVKSTMPPVEVQQGKIVFNIQKLTTTSGLTAFDLLKKMPGVSIDQDDAITLRGSSGVNVLVNEKMTYLSGAQLTTFLKGISAEDINKIELNTTPSAQYDAAGNAGVINIILKKNLKKGYAVDFRSGISKGYYWMPNANVSGSIRTKTMSLFGSLDYKKPDQYLSSWSGNNVNDNGQVKSLQRSSQSEIRTSYYTWSAGAEWQLSLKHRLNMDYLGYKDDWKNVKTAVIREQDATGNKTGSTRSLYNNIEPYFYDALNVGYRYDIDSAGRSITAEAHYINYRNYSDGLLQTDTYDPAETLLNREVLRIHQPGFIRIRSANADASLRIKRHPVKAGLKYAEVENDNPYHFDSLKGGTFVSADEISNHFNYKERIAAAYVLVSAKWNTTSIEAGLRFEYTRADGYTVRQDVNNHWEYKQLFPSLSIARAIGESDKIDISMSRRINRPSYADLNPIRWYVDQYFYYSGNPALVPEPGWVFSAAYTIRHKYILTASYNISNHFISRSLTMDGEAVKSQSANLGTMQRLDLIAALPFRLFPFWEAQLSPDLACMSYPVPKLNGERTLSRWFVTVAVQQRFNLPAGIKMNASLQYYSPGLRGIYKTAAICYGDLGVKKVFIPGRFDAQVTVSDVFNTNRFRGFSQSGVTDYYYRDKPDSRRIGITLHYHIGSDLIKASSKRTEEQDRL